jgi:hypothetical protein
MLSTMGGVYDVFLHMDSVIKLVLIKIADFKFGDKRVRQPPKSLHLGWPR